MYKNVIFDWSGPIKDISESHYWVVKKMFESLGKEEFSIEEIKENYEEPYMNFWQRFFPRLTMLEEQRLYRKILSREDYPKAVPYKNIVSSIKNIKKNGIRLVILSSDFAETIFPEIEKFEMQGVFDEIIPFVHDKSDAIGDLISKNNFKIEETILIGDSNNEISAGKKIGIKTMAVTWGLFSEERLKINNPDYLVKNIEELEDILLK